MGIQLMYTMSNGQRTMIVSDVGLEGEMVVVGVRVLCLLTNSTRPYIAPDIHVTSTDLVSVTYKPQFV